MSTTIRGDYAGLSRGKHCAKHVESGTWAERDDDGDLILNRPGKWMLHTSDGFSRKATVYVTLDENCKMKDTLGRGAKFSKV